VQRLTISRPTVAYVFSIVLSAWLWQQVLIFASLYDLSAKVVDVIRRIIESPPRNGFPLRICRMDWHLSGSSNACVVCVLVTQRPVWASAWVSPVENGETSLYTSLISLVYVFCRAIMLNSPSNGD
jgi:hypothetical protein